MWERAIESAIRDPSGFEAVALAHLDAAYGLARALLRDEHDAQDAVQDAYVRALRHFGAYRGGDARAWLLAIVRNVCITRRRRRVRGERETPLDDAPELPAPGDDPEAALLRAAGVAEVRAALAQLGPESREVLVLRELEDRSYAEIAEVIGVPVGTVMSRLARARAQLRRLLAARSLEAP